MAIRVLSRPNPIQFLQITSIPLRKIQSLSKPPNQHPQIPSKTVEITQFNNQISIASTLQRYGFPQSHLHEFIIKNRFLCDSTSSDIESCIKSLLSFGINQKSLLSILVNCPRVLQLGFLDEWRLAISEIGFSKWMLAVLEQFGKLPIEPKDFRRNVEILRNKFGFCDETIIRVFGELPAAFMKESIDVGRRIEILIDFGMKKDEIDRICGKFPLFLAYGVEGRLRPLFQEFRGLGFVQREVRHVLVENPKLVLGMEVGEISRCVELIRSLKCRVPIKEEVLLNGLFKAGIEVKLRVDFLCKYGLIRRDAFKVLYLEPRSILYGLVDIEKKIDFLMQRMGFTIEHLVEFPEYLGVNLEKHIIPRFNVIEHLKSMGGLCFKVELKHFVRLSRLKFYNLYVKPYPECEKIFGGEARENEVRPRHPPGLWKMFMPRRFPDNKDDIKNMKLFVGSLYFSTFPMKVTEKGRH